MDVTRHGQGLVFRALRTVWWRRNGRQNRRNFLPIREIRGQQFEELRLRRSLKCAVHLPGLYSADGRKYPVLVLKKLAEPTWLV